ncbi:unnamed protein product [Caenorhabditis auriculariae]|uniref:Aspartic peptidase DDI1-type domain-containing protein n=1 Tax=Caenorhabditis auriculariae TaxID=2777116 RepID=A0A8S1HBG5_9PELO|nr:unnamed protein product [Caenorhabditis auriculariae]
MDRTMEDNVTLNFEWSDGRQEKQNKTFSVAKLLSLESVFTLVLNDFRQNEIGLRDIFVSCEQALIWPSNVAKTAEELSCYEGKVLKIHPKSAETDVEFPGAQLSIISKDAAQKCDVFDLIDSRFQVTAAGVGGASEALGKILNLDLEVGGFAVPATLTVMEHTVVGTDVIIGIDILRAYQAKIDLQEMTLTLGGVAKETFLSETQVRHIDLFGVKSIFESERNP